MHKLLKSRWLESDLRLEPRYGSEFCRVIVYTSYLDDEKKQVRASFFFLFYNTPVVRSIRCFGAIHKYRNNTILTVCHDMYTYFRQVLQIYGQRSDEVATRHNSNSVFCDLPCDMENPALLVTGTCNIHAILFSYLDSSRFFLSF